MLANQLSRRDTGLRFAERTVGLTVKKLDFKRCRLVRACARVRVRACGDAWAHNAQKGEPINKGNGSHI
jgi:hypothetical protein